MTTPDNRRFLSLAFLTDATTLLFLVLVMPRIDPQTLQPSGTNSLILVVVYILFLAGIFMLRKLQPTPPATGAWLTPKVRGVLAGLFGLVLALVLTWQLGFFESLPSADPMVLGEGEAAAYFAFAPGAWIGIAMLYVLFLAFPVVESVESSEGRYPIMATVGLITTGLMLATVVAYGRLVTPESNALLWFIVAMVIMLVMFVPSRLLYASRYFDVPGRLTWVALAPLAIVVLAGSWIMIAG